MDESNEIQKMSPLWRFFEKSSVRTNPFGSNQSAHRAYRRAERIVAALYLVTNHISPEEPIRSAIRSEAILMLERMLSLGDDMRAVNSPNTIACRISIRHLVSLVRMLSVAGLVSIQNTNVVAEGLDELGNFLEVSRESSLSESLSLSREDLLGIDESPIRDIKDSKSVKDALRIKDISNASETTQKGAASNVRSVREQNILEILRSGGVLGIRDIAANLPEYSEKMIQRDLVELVNLGRVKRVGLKRWSRYSIAT